MFNDQQLDQLRQLFADSEAKVTKRIEKTLETKLSETKKDLEAKITNLETKVTKAQEEQAELIGEIMIAVDKNKNEIVDTLTERMSVALTHHDKRITRVEKHLDLPPLE